MKRDISHRSLGKPSQRAKNITVSRKGGHGAESQRDGGDTQQGPCGVTVAEATAPSLQSLLPLLEGAEKPPLRRSSSDACPVGVSEREPRTV